MNDDDYKVGVDDFDPLQMLNPHYYIHLCFVNAITSVNRMLVKEGRLLDAYVAIRVNCYIAEKLAWSCNLISPKAKGVGAEANYKRFLRKEQKRLLSEGLNVDDPLFRALLSLSKLAYIQKVVVANSPMIDDLHVD